MLLVKFLHFLPVDFKKVNDLMYRKNVPKFNKKTCENYVLEVTWEYQNFFLYLRH